MDARAELPTLPVGAAAEAGGGAVSLARGSVIGRFRVLGLLGKGGMGIVVAAHDPELDRKVALKLLLPYLAAEGRARLMREAQAMARLSHPNVITVHDVGTVGDNIFVAMELVEGGTLGKWLGERRSWREVVRVVGAAGRGLAAAHAAELVHRDFKPDNVLVGTDGRVRVTDFGLVGVSPSAPPSLEADSLLGQPLTSPGMMVGTPQYMSPEQYLGEPTDARADQFAFCVTLHQALYGVRPFEGATPKELFANVRAGRVREPPRDARVPARLRRVVLRGLAADPAARYPTMDALLEELAHDPAAARRRWLIAGAAALAVAALAVTAMRSRPPLCRGAERKLAGVWDARRRAAVHAAFLAPGKPYGDDAFRAVAGALDDYATRWTSGHTAACVATRIDGEQSEAALELRVVCLGERLDGVRALVDVLERGGAQTIAGAPRAVAELPDAASCADAMRLGQREPAPQGGWRATLATDGVARLAQARALRVAGLGRAGLMLVDPVLVAARAAGWRPLQAAAWLEAGAIALRTLGDPRRAEEALLAATEAAAAGRDGEVEADAWVELTAATSGLGRSDETIRLGRLASARVAALGGGDPARRRARLALAVAAALRDKGEYDEAARTLDEAVATMPDDAQLLDGLGQLRYRQGRLGDARKLFERALVVEEARKGPHHPDVASSLNNLANILHAAGSDEEALALLRRALDIRERALGSASPLTASVHNNLGNIFRDTGRTREARAEYAGALATAEAALGREHPKVTLYLENLALACEMEGRVAEAQALQERVLAARQKSLPADHPDLARTLERLGVLARMRGEVKVAVELHARALAMLEAKLGPDHPDIASALGSFGVAQRARGDLREARSLGERAVAMAERVEGAKHPDVGMLLTDLAETMLAQRDAAAALAAAERAVAVLEGSLGPSHPATAAAIAVAARARGSRGR